MSSSLREITLACFLGEQWPCFLAFCWQSLFTLVFSQGIQAIQTRHTALGRSGIASVKQPF